MHDEASAPGPGRAAALAAQALARAVTETETHVAAHGWDQPVRVFALVRTAEALEADPDVADLLQERPDREDIRMVVGVLRGGQSWCTLRSRSHDDDASLYRGERLVPGLVEALAATFL